jgi:transmembrane sensor
METPQLKEILTRYNAGRCTPEEMALIESWYIKHEVSGARLTESQISEIIDMEAPGTPDPTRYKIAKWIPAAAAVLILSLAGILYLKRVPEPEVIVAKNDIAPGSNKAILILANGQKIVLDHAKNGDIAVEHDTQIRKDAEGRIVYKTQQGSQVEADENIKNTISTPSGGQYRLTLSDGSKVWLNAASSITYPVNFHNQSREVQISGEAYFEIIHDGTPFIVHSKNQQVQVFGTQFNVNTYEDGPYIKTTLVEGSVGIKTSQSSKLLRPGQQSLVQGHLIKTLQVDTEVETAWKDGDFAFNRRPLKELLREVARWYNIEVDYSEYTDRNDSFTGLISRSRKLSAVLKMLEETNSINFRIAGKRLYVMN